MSHIATSKTQFTERCYLEAAIKDLLLTKERQPITDEHFLTGIATDRYGTRFESEFYISREVLGTTYGDLGFARAEDGTYNLISDLGYDYVQIVDKDVKVSVKEFVGRLNARYGAQKLEVEALDIAQREGCLVEKVVQENGDIKYLVTLNTAAV